MAHIIPVTTEDLVMPEARLFVVKALFWMDGEPVFVTEDEELHPLLVIGFVPRG